METTYNCIICKRHFKHEFVVGSGPKKCQDCQERFTDTEILNWLFENCDIVAKCSYKDQDGGRRWDCYETRDQATQGMLGKKLGM